MKHVLIVILVFLQQFSIAQNTNLFGRANPSNYKENYYYSPLILHKTLYNNIPQNHKNGVFKDLFYVYSKNISCYIHDYLYDGRIYNDWPEINNYFNQVFKKVMPDELSNDTALKLLIVKDPHFNAACTPPGIIIINIGIFSEIQDEAGIAALLAHELAHHHMKHFAKHLANSFKGEYDQYLFSFNKSSNKYSQKMELQADSLSLVWMHRAGYNADGVINLFKMSNRLENNKIHKSEKEWEIEAKTHPLAIERLENFAAVKRKNNINSAGEPYLISKNGFAKFKEEAKAEILKLHLEQFEFNECIETAFKFHLRDPDNATYIYYLMESIRRRCYLNINMWKENFITSDYFDHGNLDGARQKRKMQDHLFKKFNFHVLPFDTLEAAKLKGKFYWQGTPRFTTYDEAFEFFFRVSQILKLDECILSNALSFSNNKSKRDELLKKYLECDSIKYRKFAERLMQDSIYNALPKNKLLIVDNFFTQLKTGNQFITICKPQFDSSINLRTLLDSVCLSYKNRIPLFLYDLKEKSYFDYIMLSNLSIFSRYRMLTPTKVEFFILNPDYWELYQKYAINEIEFLNFNYCEFISKCKTINDYELLNNLSYTDFFYKLNRAKSIETYINAVRMIEDAPMKTYHYNGEYKIKATKTTAAFFIEEVVRQLKEYDKRTAMTDGEYRYNIKFLK